VRRRREAPPAARARRASYHTNTPLSGQQPDDGRAAVAVFFGVLVGPLQCRHGPHDSRGTPHAPIFGAYSLLKAAMAMPSMCSLSPALHARRHLRLRLSCLSLYLSRPIPCACPDPLIPHQASAADQAAWPRPQQGPCAGAPARQRTRQRGAARLDGGVVDLALDLRVGRLVWVALVGQPGDARQALAQQQRRHCDRSHRLRAAGVRLRQQTAAPQP